jgi:hypothetical protein
VCVPSLEGSNCLESCKLARRTKTGKAHLPGPRITQSLPPCKPARHSRVAAGAVESRSCWKTQLAVKRTGTLYVARALEDRQTHVLALTGLCAAWRDEFLSLRAGPATHVPVVF